MWVGGQRHCPAALPRHQLYRRLVRPQGWSGRVLKISPPPGFGPRTVQLVAIRYTDYAIPAYRKCVYGCEMNLIELLYDSMAVLHEFLKEYINESNFLTQVINRWWLFKKICPHKL
jgi:hypothetical protein